MQTSERLTRLREAFRARVVGHAEAVRRLLEGAALRLSYGAGTGLVPVLTGPRGSGRRALAEALAAGLSAPLRTVALAGLSAQDLRGRPRGDGGEPGVLRSRLGPRPDGVVLLEGLDRLGDGDRQGARRHRAALCLRTLLDRSERFVDRYQDEVVSLDDTIVVATADHADGIPEPLRDLVMVIPLRGYDQDERIEIGARFLLPDALRRAGAPEGRVQVTEEALTWLALAYGDEAGVALLAARLRDVVRRAAARIALGEASEVRLDRAALEELLGPPPRAAMALRRDRAEVGVSVGLVWTRDGGDLALVEALIDAAEDDRPHRYAGVRPEAVESALAFLRAEAQELRLDRAALDAASVSVRATSPPREVEGARAGLDLAVLLALASVATDRPVRSDVASVGSVTLRGAVQPLPGLPEMVVGASRRGVRTVLLPDAGLDEVRRALPKSTLAQVTLEPVRHVGEAARAALIDIVIAREIK